MTDKTELAEDRTKWAEDRTILANERTFAGWMRTGMACVALALGLKAVFGDFEPTWIAKSVALIFIGASLLIYASAAIKARKAQKRIDEHITEAQSGSSMTLLAVILSTGSILTGAILWWL